MIEGRVFMRWEDEPTPDDGSDEPTPEPAPEPSEPEE